MGPVALFDKSFLQTLSTDESVWFDNYFYTVICPLFYIETLADLQKKPREGKTQEEEVGIIAAKTPQRASAPCYFHQTLVIQNLRGHRVPLTGQIPMAGARKVKVDGKIGVIFDEPPESKAFHRWQEGKFQEVERLHAKSWRYQLATTDLSAIAKRMQASGINSKVCKSLDQAKGMAEIWIQGLTKSFGRFDLMLNMLGVPKHYHSEIKSRWKRSHKCNLDHFAPYAAHVAKVEMFFEIALGANLISSARASNKADIGYLFYLPFCNVFISNDRLHEKCAPLFLRSDQVFVNGNAVKADLKKLNEHFSAFPDEVKSLGISSFATTLPDEFEGIVKELTKRFTPFLLNRTSFKNAPRNTKSAKEVMDEARRFDKAPSIAHGISPDSQDFDQMIIKRSVSVQKGSWLQVKPSRPSTERVETGSQE